MAVTYTLTGANQSVTATNGSPNVTVASTTGWVVGATVQGTGWAAGTKIVSFVANTSAVFSNNFTGTTGATNIIVSSVYGSALAVEMSGATDTATPQGIINAGFANALVGGTFPMAQIIGALTVRWANIVSGAIFDFGNWGLYFGSGGRWLFQESSILGELRGGYLVNGTQFIKTAGPSFYCWNWNNNGAGGSSMFENVSGTTNQGLFRMHNPRFIELNGGNAAFVFASGRMTMAVENMILDYQGDANGANAGLGAAFGTVKNTYLVKTNGGILQTNGSNYATLDGLIYLGNYQASPNHKFSLPQGYVLDGYAPQVLSTQLLGGFNSATLETYSNINLSTAGWGLSDLKTKYQRYGGPITLQFPRTVAFQFKDSSAAALTNVSLYISSSGTSLVNAVQAGDYSALSQGLNLTWTGSTAAYRTADSFVDTISQTAQFRKNGYVSQSVSYSINTAAYTQPIFMLADPAYGSVTPTQAAALTGLSLDFTNKVYTVSTAHNLDEVYAFGQYSLALTANSAQADFQTSTGGKYKLTNPWKMSVTSGALTMGSYNNTFNSQTAWTFGNTASLTLDKDDVVWTPAVRADLFQFQSGSTCNIINGSTLTVSPTAGLGYGAATTSEFRSGSTLNLTDSTVTYNIVTSGSGTVFSNTEAGATWNISNSTLTLNCPNGAQVAVHAYFLPASVISNFTVNGTASNVIWQMGYTSNNSKMVGFKFGGAIFGNGTSNVLMDTYTYTGALTTIPNTFGSANKWWWVDPVMNAGGLFRWNAGATATGSDGFYGVIGFRPTITMDKVGYAPKVRFTPSAMATRYPSFQVQSTALSTLALSNFFRDPTFMSASDGFLPFIDALDAKNVLNTINWTVDARLAGWQDQSVSFSASTAKKGTITATLSGAVDANYVNASTAAADSALITVNTSTNTIAPVTGTLAWSPQRLYNALKNWWATYASNTNFLSATGSGTLDLGYYNVDESLSFVAGSGSDALTGVRTTGRIYAATNGISVTDSLGTSLLYKFTGLASGLDSSVCVFDGSGTTKLFINNPSSTASLYVPSGSSGTYKVAVRKYGKKPQYTTFDASAGGTVTFAATYIDDVGISQPTLATVQAYTQLEANSKVYDYYNAWALAEQGMKLGDVLVRDGTAINAGSYSGKVKATASSLFNITGSLVTIKAPSLAADSKFDTIIATPPATWTADTTEVITTNIEDGNGDSSIDIEASGVSTFEIWKITNATPPDDYATGTLLATVGIGKWRFLAAEGYKAVVRDTTTNFRVVESMSKGNYMAELFFGSAVQLAQAPEVTQINSKVTVLQNDITAIKGAGFAGSTDSLDAIRGAIDSLPQAGDVIDANIVKVNNLQVGGSGTESEPWGPTN